MAKAVVYGLLTTVFILFLVSSPIKQRGRNHSGLISRRLGYKLPMPMPTFDPLVSQMKRVAEENKSSHHTSTDDLENGAHKVEVEDNAHKVEGEDDSDYFGEEGKLNLTLRLMYLFPLLDNAPRDEVVSLKELEDWNIEQAIDGLNYRTKKELALYDKNEDEAISFEEYLPQISKEDIEKNGMGHGEAGWWKEQFMNADVDRNGILNFDEFNNFLHPEDSNNDAIHKWLLREKMERMDEDNDGKLSFQEFLENAYYIYKSYVEFEGDRPNLPTAEEKFAELDVNKDEYLEVEELKPIFNYLHPGEVSYAKYYSNYLIHEADDDKDGNLSLDEMLNHEYIFYNTIYNHADDHDEDDYDYDYDFYDEL